MIDLFNWKSIGLFWFIMVIGELVATFIFWLVSKAFKRGGLSFNSVVRGVLERFFIYFSMVHGVMHALTLFGALKIATHIRDDDKVTNDYFLIGNLISAFFAIFYYLIFKATEANYL